MLSINKLKHKLYIPQYYPILLRVKSCQPGPSGSDIGLVWALGVTHWVGGLKYGSNFRSKLKSKKLKPVLGLVQAPRVQIWVQSGSAWPSGSKIHQIFSSWSSLSQIQSTMIDENDQLFTINYAVNYPTQWKPKKKKFFIGPYCRLSSNCLPEYPFVS